MSEGGRRRWGSDGGAVSAADRNHQAAVLWTAVVVVKPVVLAVIRQLFRIAVRVHRRTDAGGERRTEILNREGTLKATVR